LINLLVGYVSRITIVDGRSNLLGRAGAKLVELLRCLRVWRSDGSADSLEAIRDGVGFLTVAVTRVIASGVPATKKRYRQLCY
jgi:hypothetical protein